MNGIIIVNKEPGFTSFDVVAKLRGICRQRKIGHTGTLDPAATGVLPVCLGSGTKLCDMLTDKEKEYVAELLLGVRTDTQDTTGQILSTEKVTATEGQIREVCAGFVGEYDQVPPMYSALKINGKKLYELAREGKVVERKARHVCIHELEILEMNLPVVKLRVRCSKGTYIRTLCEDIGNVLGCGGTMQSLQRTKVGPFTLDQALTLSQIQTLRDEDRLETILRPVDSVFAQCPALHVTAEGLKLLENGNVLSHDQLTEHVRYPAGEWVRIYRPDQSFAGIYAYVPELQKYKPVKMFLERE